MLTNDAKAAILSALTGLREGDAGGWRALTPLTRLAVEGSEVTVDFTTENELGAPLIIVRTNCARRLPGCLSSRQREVAEAVAKGLSNKEIARKLRISTATVKDHVGAVLAATGLKSRSEFIAYLHRMIKT